ncbi:MAG: hypothetical protein ABI439_11855 [Rhodospirillales bacterium]
MTAIVVVARRFFLLALLGALAAAWAQPTFAADVITLEIQKGTGDSRIYVVRDPRAALNRGGTVDGLPVLRKGQSSVIAWRAMRHLVFVPGDIPTALITHRDGSRTEIDVEPCRIVSADTDIDIHDVADINVR